MHDDLIDAVYWAINQEIADPKKIAIFGFFVWWLCSACGCDIYTRLFFVALLIVWNK